MNRYKQTFSDYSTEYLLERRALGDEIDDEAHAAIEDVLAARGVAIPPRPTAPILASSIQRRPPLFKQWSFWGGLLLALVALAAGKALAHTWIGLVYTAGFLGYYAVRHLRRGAMTEEELREEDNKRRIKEDGVTDLMLMAAEGNLKRVQELVDYGALVNECSHTGATALIYAARNGHRDVAEYLLSVGADKSITTNKGSTARSIAERNGHSGIAAIL
ncbi:hypothetical protein GCM10027399_03100 [Curvibacter fontanus]|jgi:hypothetical protein